MFTCCPYCGYKLFRPLENGIITCLNCDRIFSDSEKNKVLAAAWHCRNKHFEYAEMVRHQYKLSDEQVEIRQKYVIDKNYSHDDLLKLTT